MTAPVLPGPGFAVTVPPSWFEVDLAPATRDAAIACLVDDRVRDSAELRPHRSAITGLLREQARQAWEAGARWCAVMVEPTDEGPITASATVSVVPGPLGQTAGTAAHAAALLAPLAPKTAASEDDTWRDVVPVDLDGVPGARAWGVEDVDLPEDRGWVRTVSLQQLLPVPGSDRVVLLACSSPVLPLADVLHDLFAAIADSVRVVRASGGTP
jgi:hypothetical protein